MLISQWTQAPQDPFRPWAQAWQHCGVAQQSGARVGLKHEPPRRKARALALRLAAGAVRSAACRSALPVSTKPVA
jgi:hypothetical protein